MTYFNLVLLEDAKENSTIRRICELYWQADEDLKFTVSVTQLAKDANPGLSLESVA